MKFLSLVKSILVKDIVKNSSRGKKIYQKYKRVKKNMPDWKIAPPPPPDSTDVCTCQTPIKSPLGGNYCATCGKKIGAKPAFSPPPRPPAPAPKPAWPATKPATPAPATQPTPAIPQASTIKPATIVSFLYLFGRIA